MRYRYLQGAILRFALCLFTLLMPLVSLHAQDTLTTGTPFNIVNENSGLCIGASGQGTANGTVLQMYACANGTYSTQLSQEWIFTSAASGYYEVADANATTEAWNVVGNGTTNGSLMQIWAYAGNSNEEFEAVSLGGGYYKFVGEGSGLCLDVPGNSTANGVQLEIYTCNGTTAQAFKLVTPSAPSGEGPYGGTPAGIPGTVLAENYDTGGQGVGYNVTSVNGSANSYRSDGVDLEAASSPATGNDLGWTASGQWFRYTVNVSSAGNYLVSFLVASESTVTDAFHISNSSGTNLSGSVEVPDTGGWQTWTTVTATVTLPAGKQTLTLNQDNGGWNFDSAEFTESGGGGGTDEPFGGTPATIPGTVMNENYDTGGQGVAYNATSTNGTDNGYRSDGIDLETASAPATGNDLGWTTSGQWFKYTVNVSTAGTYTVSFLVTGDTAVSDAFHLSNSSGTNLTGSVAIPSTGGWQTWTTVTATVMLPAGTQTLTLDEDNGGWNIDSMAFASGSGGGVPAKTFAPFEYVGDLSNANQIPGIVSASGAKAVILAFLDPSNGGCNLIWPGASAPLPTDSVGGTSMATAISDLQAAGVTVGISQGGAGGQEAAAYCGTAAETQAVYQQIITLYHVKWLDFDVEYGETSGQSTRRAQALAALQKANPGLMVSYTLPADTPSDGVLDGLDEGGNGGTTDVTDAISAGVSLTYVNGMAMDFGNESTDQGTLAEQTAAAIESWLKSEGISSKVGITVLPGTSDDEGAVFFTLADATTVVNFANANSYVGLLSFWELNRDNGGCPGSSVDEDNCDGLSQSNYQVSSIFEAY
jgi:hypothetical protein